LRRRKSAPQKVKPKPMSARTWDPAYMEKISDEIPEIKNKTLILIEIVPPILLFDFKSLDLFANSRFMKALSIGNDWQRFL